MDNTDLNMEDTTNTQSQRSNRIPQDPGSRPHNVAINLSANPHARQANAFPAYLAHHPPQHHPRVPTTSGGLFPQGWVPPNLPTSHNSYGMYPSALMQAPDYSPWTQFTAEQISPTFLTPSEMTDPLSQVPEESMNSSLPSPDPLLPSNANPTSNHYSSALRSPQSMAERQQRTRHQEGNLRFSAYQEEQAIRNWGGYASPSHAHPSQQPTRSVQVSGQGISSSTANPDSLIAQTLSRISSHRRERQQRDNNSNSNVPSNNPGPANPQRTSGGRGRGRPRGNGRRNAMTTDHDESTTHSRTSHSDPEMDAFFSNLERIRAAAAQHHQPPTQASTTNHITRRFRTDPVSGAIADLTTSLLHRSPSPTFETLPRPPAKSDAEMQREISCTICREQDIDRVCLPCGHACMCKWCYQVWRGGSGHNRRGTLKCPICREVVGGVKNIYFS
ncbi:MAG: hypothetical protein Q9227_002910 [Pyrenula ochraceoflavens]